MNQLIKSKLFQRLEHKIVDAFQNCAKKIILFENLFENAHKSSPVFVVDNGIP